LRTLVERYSDYLAHPIELPKAGEAGVFEPVNRASALWKRPARELEKAQYVEFYKHLTHDWEEPIAYRHFHIEGTQEFTGLLFLPARPPLDLFDPEQRHGVRLHVRRVFVMDDCAELVPRFLRFVRGVIDSEDLPLNVSREILQDSRIVHTIRKQVVQQVLDLLSELASERPEDYAKFYAAFGAVLKEGLHFEPEHKQKLAKLVRYESTAQGKLIALDEYIASMPATQTAIYYVTGLSRAVAASSPHLERVRAKGYDVLLLTDPVDSFVMDQFTEYEGKKLISVTAQNLGLDEEKPAGEQEPAADTKTASLLQRFKEVLQGNVTEVRASTRLTDSPACLVTPEGGLPPHVERMLRAQKRDIPPTRRILELNLEHPLVKSIERLELVDPGSERARGWMELIHEQALLAEGSPIEDPAQFAKKLTRLMTAAAEHELSLHGGA
jgi:molecular chaperone HtpG